jgi:hypothetical protein
MSNGCGRGGRPIRGTGEHTGAGRALRYKTPLRPKSLRDLKIYPLVRYKTPCACKALFLLG